LDIPNIRQSDNNAKFSISFLEFPRYPSLEALKQMLQKNALYLSIVNGKVSNVSIPRNIEQSLINDVQTFNNSIFSIMKQKIHTEHFKFKISSETFL